MTFRTFNSNIFFHRHIVTLGNPHSNHPSYPTHQPYWTKAPPHKSQFNSCLYWGMPLYIVMEIKSGVINSDFFKHIPYNWHCVRQVLFQLTSDKLVALWLKMANCQVALKDLRINCYCDCWKEPFVHGWKRLENKAGIGNTVQ